MTKPITFSSTVSQTHEDQSLLKRSWNSKTVILISSATSSVILAVSAATLLILAPSLITAPIITAIAYGALVCFGTFYHTLHAQTQDFTKRTETQHTFSLPMPQPKAPKCKKTTLAV